MVSAYALVLTARPGSGAIREAHAEAIWSLVPRPSALGRRWLVPGGDAWEMTFTGEGPAEAQRVRDVAEKAFEGLPVDVNVVAEAIGGGGRAKRLLCADMESTVIAQELIDEMADLVGCRAEISAITDAAMKGEIDFEASLVRRVALFKGFAAERLEEILARVTPMPGAETLTATMRAHGARTALVSGGFTIFAERIGKRLGFDAVAANVLEIAGGRLTGEVRTPILGPKGKAEALRRLAAEAGLAAADTLAVGDGANDRLMLAAAGLGVAFRAKPVLAGEARAAANGAVVRHGDLTALLALQGYTGTEHAA